VSSQAYEIDLVLFRVTEYFAIRLAFAHSVLNVAPKMSLRRNGFLQAMRSLVISVLPSERRPRNLGFI
jgi:hypothetical protein